MGGSNGKLQDLHRAVIQVSSCGVFKFEVLALDLSDKYKLFVFLAESYLMSLFKALQGLCFMMKTLFLQKCTMTLCVCVNSPVLYHRPLAGRPRHLQCKVASSPGQKNRDGACVTESVVIGC